MTDPCLICGRPAWCLHGPWLECLPPVITCNYEVNNELIFDSPTWGPFHKAGWTNSESLPELWVDLLWDGKLWVSSSRTAGLKKFSQLWVGSPWVKWEHNQKRKPSSMEPRFVESPWQREGGLRVSPIDCRPTRSHAESLKSFLFFILSLLLFKRSTTRCSCLRERESV